MERLSSDDYLLINETFIADHNICSQWFIWVIENLIPVIKATDLTENIILSRIIADYNPDGISYALQFLIKESDFETFDKDRGIYNVRKSMNEIFKNKIASFQTRMLILNSEFK